MRTIVHISDLHFGRVDPAILSPLAEKILQISPDALVVTGDLTQRARRAEFAAAAQFLSRLPFPRVVIPGNHDISLTDPFQRLFRPLGRFRSHIHPDLEPTHADGEIAIFGANTASPWLVTNGRLGARQLRSLRSALDSHGPDVFKIVATHHPLAAPPRTPDKALARGAGAALASLAAGGADLLLSGHLHLHHAEEARSAPSGRLLSVSAGTASSTRLRDEPNSFNALRVQKGRVDIERLDWDNQALAFLCASRLVFLKSSTGWAPA